MRDYKTITSGTGCETIQFEENGIVYSIPKDPANSDYQAYLESIAEDTNGNI
jgi:hypothetical protein